jgi:hypothetical protein
VLFNHPSPAPCSFACKFGKEGLAFGCVVHPLSSLIEKSFATQQGRFEHEAGNITLEHTQGVLLWSSLPVHPDLTANFWF